MGSLREPAGVPDHWHDDSEHPLGGARSLFCPLTGLRHCVARFKLLAQFVERATAWFVATIVEI
jgi:hypothetical protein